MIDRDLLHIEVELGKLRCVTCGVNVSRVTVVRDHASGLYRATFECHGERSEALYTVEAIYELACRPVGSGLDFKQLTFELWP